MRCLTAGRKASPGSSHRRTVRRALASGVEVLRAAGIDSCRLDAELLLCESLGIDRAQLYVAFESVLDAATAGRFYQLVERRSRREPVAYILRRKEFWSLEFVVTPDVLIPRPETERLVEVALECARQIRNPAPLKVLDLGTGSGVIPICMGKELKEAEFWSLDLSANALAVATANIRRHGLEDKIRLVRANMLEPLPLRGVCFDLIVSNPPYVLNSELPELSPDLRYWEPLTALDGGSEGMDYYGPIMAHADDHLAGGGWVVVEIGAGMAPRMRQGFGARGGYTEVSVFQDYAGKDRVVAARRRPSGRGIKETRSG